MNFVVTLAPEAMEVLLLHRNFIRESTLSTSLRIVYLALFRLLSQLNCARLSGLKNSFFLEHFRFY